MLTHAMDSVRLFLHVLGATIWVGGQFTLAALVPILRARDPELPRIVARAFNKVAWPAFGLLVVTGIWNMAQIPSDASKNYHAVLGAKMVIVLLSGAAAYVHTRVKRPSAIALWGSISGLAAISATYLGVLLAG